MKAQPVFHLHLESFRDRPAAFHLTEESWETARKRHRALAKRLRVTIGWDGDIIDEALKTADFMINSSPPRERLRERAPRLKWIQTTGAGVEGLIPLGWLPADVVLTNNSGAHGAKAESPQQQIAIQLRVLLEHDQPPAAVPVELGRLVSLSARERALTELLAQGCTDETIARQLGLSRRTVSYAVSALMRRVGARNRFQLGWILGGEVLGGEVLDGP